MSIAPTTSPHNLAADWQSQIPLLDQLRILLLICIGDTIVHVNPAALRILGLKSPADVVGQSFFSLLHRDYAELSELGLAVFAEEQTVVSVKMMRPDGKAVDADLWVSPMTTPGAFLVEARDITEHLKAARALRLREQRLEGILNTVADGIITLDEHGTIQTFNPAAEGIFGFSRTEMVGQSIRTLLPDTSQDAPADGADWVRSLAATSEVAGKTKSGEVVPLEMSIRELQQGDEKSFTSIVRDITARKAEEQRVFRMAHHDALTGLPNRHLFDDRVLEAFKRARRHKEKLALLFVDLDRFKPINDTFGHAVGDEVLKLVAGRLRTSLRATDTVARVGGDEFMVLLEELSDAQEAEDVRRKLQEDLCQPLWLRSNNVTIGASIGVAVYPDDGAEIADLMVFADRDMYGRKHGR
ncbi:MAG TPA: diguanylate cyclase [Rhodospirillaceae bacterium]|nr:diguanylate cyclase [Rhodospirillaceae bacterium]